MSLFTNKPLTSANVFATRDILLALVPPINPPQGLTSLVAFLKLGTGAGLMVSRSMIEFIDATGQAVAKLDNAFQLTEGTDITGPYSGELIQSGLKPLNAALLRWHLNEVSVESSLLALRKSNIQQVIYLPLQVAIENDYHIIVTIVNTGVDLLNIAEGVRQAVLRVDGISYQSIAGRVWNGAYQLRPWGVAIRRFRLSDFPGSPREGAHQISLEMFEEQSESMLVNWFGESWANDNKNHEDQNDAQ